MRPVKTADATIVYKAPQSMPECGDLWVHRIRPGIIRSTWEPNEQERALIAAGGRIQLTLAHEPIPPIMLEVMDKDITEPVEEHPWRIDREPKLSPPKEAAKNGNPTTEQTTEAESSLHAEAQSEAQGSAADAVPSRAQRDDVPAQSQSGTD